MKMTMKDILSPSVESRKELSRKINDVAYLVMIGLITLVVIFIPPFFTGCLQSDIGMVFPKTMEGWVLWGIMNGSTAIANMSILVLFKLQAKKNCREEPNFKRANEILNRLAGKKEVFIPRSPRKMDATDYGIKILAIAVTTLTASVTLTSLILSFDWMTLLSCLVSTLVTLIISWVTMLNNEVYWKDEYILYAEMIEKQASRKAAKEETQNESQVRKQRVQKSAGTGSAEHGRNRQD